MSSKKDLLDRMAKQGRTVTRRRKEETATPGSSAETQTRVASGVIRRRTRKRRPATAKETPQRRSDLPGLSQPAPEARPASPPVRKRDAAPTPEPSPPKLPTLSAANEEAPAPEPPAAVESAAAPEPSAPPVAEPAEASAPVVAEQAPAPEPAAKPQARPEPAPAVEAKPEPQSRPEPAPAEPAPAPAPEPVAAAPEPAPAPPQARSEPDAGSRFTGLGPAVIRPPPGYDPNDPLGNRRRAREAAQQSTQQRAPVAQQRWAREPSGREADPAAAPASASASGRGRTPPDDRGGRRSRRRRGRVEARMDRVSTPGRRRRSKKAGPKASSPKPKAQKRKVQVDNTISVRHLAQEMSVRSGQVLKTLLNMGVMSNINEQLDFETAQLVAAEFEYEVVNVGFQEEQHLINVLEDVDEGASEDRPPVITVMGHVDHGKTTLLDAIRNADVAAGEAGGITQHIGAYQVKRDGELITFIDTPGHSAFTEMRARGAKATDIVILVVAADDGVMPQTVESINHTKAAGVPIVVAVNKCDKPGVDPNAIRQKLMEYELVPEEYGGETMMVNVSALKQQGIDELLDAVLLVAELQELHANPDRHAEGVVLEAKLEQGRGTVATLLIQQGTLSKGDPLVLGNTWGKVRAMSSGTGKKLKSAGPSTPVEIIGLQGVPEPGDHFVVVGSEKDAKTLAEHRAEETRHKALNKRQKVTLQDLIKSQQEAEVKKLNLIIKGDVQGSIEALKGALAKVEVEGCEVNVLHSAVGGVSESDITLASTYDGIVIGFNVRPDAKARREAESKDVEVRTYRVIYDVLDDIEKALKGMLEPVFEERVKGHAEVRATFTIPRIGTIAGCFITDGMVARSQRARLLREGVVIWDGKLGSLKRFKDDVREVEKGYECGLGLEAYNDIKVGDEIETYLVEEVART
ncbi:MAG: translation initiation factor IF-2 [Alphaproteobacteria bacterium]|nr:translation initiation factor IF-2 [Alphaproteobacteria bacterium]